MLPSGGTGAQHSTAALAASQPVSSPQPAHPTLSALALVRACDRRAATSQRRKRNCSARAVASSAECRAAQSSAEQCRSAQSSAEQCRARWRMCSKGTAQHSGVCQQINKEIRSRAEQSSAEQRSAAQGARRATPCFTTPSQPSPVLACAALSVACCAAPMTTTVTMQPTTPPCR